MDSIYFTDPLGLLIELVLSLRAARRFHPRRCADGESPHPVQRGDYAIAEIHLADAIELDHPRPPEPVRGPVSQGPLLSSPAGTPARSAPCGVVLSSIQPGRALAAGPQLTNGRTRSRNSAGRSACTQWPAPAITASSAGKQPLDERPMLGLEITELPPATKRAARGSRRHWEAPETEQLRHVRGEGLEMDAPGIPGVGLDQVLQEEIADGGVGDRALELPVGVGALAHGGKVDLLHGLDERTCARATGATSTTTRRSTRPARVSARRIATLPPRLWPITAGRLRSWRSMNAATSPAISSKLMVLPRASARGCADPGRIPGACPQAAWRSWSSCAPSPEVRAGPRRPAGLAECVMGELDAHFQFTSPKNSAIAALARSGVS